MAKLAYQVALLTKQVVYSVYQVAYSSRGLELKKQKKKFAEKKEEKGRLVLVLVRRRTGKGPEDYDFLPAMV